MKKTLILRFSSLGDVAMIVPIIRCLCKKHPDEEFIIVSRKKFKPLFEEHQNLSFFQVDFENRHKGFYGIFKLFKDLKKIKPNKVADLHHVLRTRILTVLFKLCFYNVKRLDKMRTEKNRLTRSKNKVFKPLTPIHFKYQEVFNKLGYQIDLSKDHTYPMPKTLNNFEITTNKPKVGIAPFAKHIGKVYPLDLMQKIIAYLSQNNQVFLFGFGEELKILEKWKSSYKNVDCPSSNTNFRQEVELISNLDLMISMDSANGHIASIYNVPVITIWGLTHPFTGFSTFNSIEENQFTVDRTQFPLIPTSIYGNKKIKGYEDAMRSIDLNGLLYRADQILNQTSS
ncbi:MAG: ADP-heptose--LPS heptosyltransferase RfaF [Flavobacteriaceae bacterium]|nr:ADP-heptose--LPS heptosyltransferase RfaF [Flavobacteriaceae bacterium]